jgi:hypothetical protein
MPTYCKAYKVKDLREFEGWASAAAVGLTDDDICYLWDDYTLTRNCFGEPEKLFDTPTSEWKTFCSETLEFEVPADCRGDQSHGS